MLKEIHEAGHHHRRLHARSPECHRGWIHLGGVEEFQNQFTKAERIIIIGWDILAFGPRRRISL